MAGSAIQQELRREEIKKMGIGSGVGVASLSLVVGSWMMRYRNIEALRRLCLLWLFEDRGENAGNNVQGFSQ